MYQHGCKVVVVALAIVTAAGCAAAPRARPLPTEKVDGDEPSDHAGDELAARRRARLTG